MDDWDDWDEPHPYPHPWVLALARALQVGHESRFVVAERIAVTLGGEGERWMFDLAEAWVRIAPGALGRIAWWLSTWAPLLDWIERHPEHSPSVHWPSPQRALPNRGVPIFATPGDLAVWLGWSSSVLEGHADLHHWHRRQPGFRDYVVRWHGARLIEAPKDRLKRAQRRILTEILDGVPTHPCAHGFVRGRSVHTHAALHTGRAWVLRLDLRCFFGSIHAARVQGVFRSLGYPSRVAGLLTGLTTTWTPGDVTIAYPWNQPHLPQGAPTSPALANAIAWRLDRRLHGLAVAEGCTYSRYADDLTFSGARPRRVFLELVEQIVRDEDFALRHDKTRLRSQGTHQRVTGLVVNTTPGVARKQRDRIRALVHRAEHHGWGAVQVPDVADPEAWVRGWVSWIHAANPAHGAPLVARLAELDRRTPDEP